MPLSLPQSLSSVDLDVVSRSLFNSTAFSQHLSELSERELQMLYFNNSGEPWHHVDDPRFDLLRRPAWRGLIVTLYITVIVIGLVGNTVVVFIVAKTKHMQNVTNIFIANLAMSDIGLCAFSLPIQLHYQITDYWIFGHVMCKVISSAFAIPMYVSTITIFLIACDRYWLIVYPLRDRMQTCTAITLIISAIILSIILAIPVAFHAVELHHRDLDLKINKRICTEEWNSKALRLAYSISTFVFQFCLPLIITGLLYYKIYCRLRSRPTRSRAANSERTGKTNKILFAIVVLFIICWLPWNMYSLLTEIEHTIVKGVHYKLVDLLLKMFAMSSACINPFLYCWLNDNFRKELDSMALKLHLIRPAHGPRVQYHITPAARAENGNTTTYGDNNVMCPTMITADPTSHISHTHLSPSNSQNFCHSTNNNSHPATNSNFLTVS